MAIAHFKFGGVVIERQFSPPARAGELKYWYKAAAKAIGVQAPLWNDQYKESAHYDVDAIVFEGVGIDRVPWVLTIARKRNFR